ncbi:hypothetical protein CN918_30550 [Priestia megaterium]|nr:hypothetical protein CN918_30550 [Priestia megaterium]
MNALSTFSTSEMITYIQTHVISHHIILNQNHIYGRKKAGHGKKFYNFQLTFLQGGDVSLKIGTRPRERYKCDSSLLDALGKIAKVNEG